MFDGATAAIIATNVSFASFVTAIAQSAVLVSALIINTSVGGQGLQKPIRSTFVMLFVSAMLIKGYVTLTTGALGLF